MLGYFFIGLLVITAVLGYFAYKRTAWNVPFEQRKKWEEEKAERAIRLYSGRLW